MAAEHEAFFIRTDYLSAPHTQEIARQIEAAFASDAVFDAAHPLVFTDDEAAELLDCAEVFIAEQKAMQYLARQEHSRFLLMQKLVKKSFTNEHIQKALDFLEATGSLSDMRYAEAFLHARSTQKSEGRTKLAAALASKGIGTAVAKKALADFFENNPENALAEKAVQKYQRTHPKCTLQEYLLRNGFSYRLAKSKAERYPV
ncbi:MAG: hypothetical protein Ta2A_16390 [Treponemataceae bacterium]|nr:MAG: hypothetical protein Ta2A_16390 [Treponemataceae bacterium]